MSSSRHTSESDVEEEDEEDNDDEENSPVLPSAESSARVLAQSSSYWNSLLQQSTSMNMDSDMIRLCNLRHRFPGLPDEIPNVVHLVGQATWNLTSGCKVGWKQRKGGEWRFLLDLPGARDDVKCSAAADQVFRLPESQPSGVSLAFLAWSYILCAKLTEMHDGLMQYTREFLQHSQHLGQSAHSQGDQASRLASSQTNSVEIQMREASIDELQWWQSLVFSNRGWETEGPYRPPWAVDVPRKLGNLVIFSSSNEDQSNVLDREDIPPSSYEAAGYLEKFVRTHHIDRQSSLGLVMALNIPLLYYLESDLQLSPISAFTLPNKPLMQDCQVMNDYKHLPRYMILGLNVHFLLSCLMGIFWEQNIDCHLVSQWWEPLLHITEDLLERGSVGQLGHIFALRCPAVAPLWYGLLACGQTKMLHGIVSYLSKMHFPLDWKLVPEISAWIGLSQSYMDVPGSGPYVIAGKVKRADAWRLRHETATMDNAGDPNFKGAPSKPWPPFGEVYEVEMEPSVRAHLECDRHVWRYAGWEWVSFDGSRTELDPGLALNTPHESLREDSKSYQRPTSLSHDKRAKPLRISKGNIASKMATKEAFRWSSTEMEPSGKEIYAHPWVGAVKDVIQPTASDQENEEKDED